MINGVYYCRRKRGGAQTIVWFYADACGQQRCRCLRSVISTPDDFDILSPVPTFAVGGTWDLPTDEIVYGDDDYQPAPYAGLVIGAVAAFDVAFIAWVLIWTWS